MKLLVGIPTNRDWKLSFTTSVLELGFHLSRLNIEANIRPFASSCLSQSRQSLLNMAIEKNFSHLLFIDDDMFFKMEALNHLLSRNKDFVAPNIALRNTSPVRTNTVGANDTILTSVGKTGIEKIKLTGLAFTLINVEAIKKIPAPHFEVMWSNDINAYVHEDEYFCTTLRKHGIELYVDHDASRYIWHLGQDAQQEKFTT